MPGDEGIILQMRIGAVNAVDLFGLPGTERFVTVQAPNARKQALSAKNFVDSGDTSRITVSGIEKRRVGIRDFDRTPPRRPLEWCWTMEPLWGPGRFRGRRS